MTEGRLPMSRQRFTSCLTTSIFHLLVAPEALGSSFTPKLSSGLPSFYTSSSKYHSIRHSTILCFYDNTLHWGLLWVDVSIQWEDGLSPLPLQKGRKITPKSELSLLWEFHAHICTGAELISRSLLGGVCGVKRSKSTKTPLALMISGFIYSVWEERTSSEILANVEHNKSATVDRLSNVSLTFGMSAHLTQRDGISTDSTCLEDGRRLLNERF